jgi:hypothetical protein
MVDNMISATNNRSNKRTYLFQEHKSKNPSFLQEIIQAMTPNSHHRSAQQIIAIKTSLLWNLTKNNIEKYLKLSKTQEQLGISLLFLLSGYI